MEQYVKGFKGFTPVKMCGLSPLASFYSRLRFRQSNRKREIETRCHLSRLLVSETRHIKTGPKTFLENVGQKTRLDFSRKRRAKNETRFFVFVKTCSKTNSEGLHH